MSRRRTPTAALRLVALGALGSIIAIIAITSAGPAARAVPATPPAPQAMPPLVFPAFAEHTMPNGLRVILIERHSEPEVSLRLVAPAGKLYESADRAGLAGATADLLTEGTVTRSAPQIAAAIDGVGGSLESGSSADFAFVSATVTSDQVDLALDLLADVVLHPSFPAAELERWRRKALSSLDLQRANAAYLAGVAFQREVFGTYPYGLPQDGTPATLRALTRDDLAAFHRRHFLPNGSLLAVVGDFHPAQALASVERALGSWQRGAATPPPPLALPAPETTSAAPGGATIGTAAPGGATIASAAPGGAAGHRTVLVLDKPDAVQTQIRVGQAALAYTDPDFFVAAVYNTILGGSSSGRLFREIRRDRGLAYGAYSSFAEQLTSGTFSANTSTKTASTVEALRLTLDLIDRMAAAPVPAAEIDEAKTFLNGSFPLQIETAGNVANRVLTAYSYGRGRDFLDHYRERIAAVTAADIQRFARDRLHAGRMTVVLVGNAAAFGADLQKLVGPYQTLPAAGFDPLAPAPAARVQ